MPDIYLDFDGPYFDADLIDARGNLSRLCKGGPSAKQINQQKKDAKKQQQLLQRQMQMQQKQSAAALKAMSVELPPPADIAPPPPEAQQTSSDTTSAMMDKKKQLAKRQGLSKTRVAGETGGYLGGGSAQLGTSGASTLLA